MFANFVFDRLYKMYANFFNSKPDSIIDPLTCIIRLAVLEFKPKNTKISIANNRIRYCDPTILQGPLRWGNGDNREDIHNIYNPIIKALQWYDVEKEDIKNIFKYSIKGINKLKNTYEQNSTISHSLEHYIEYIKKNIRTKSKVVEENNSIFIQLRNLWNDREISIVNNLLLELDESNDESLISAIDAILLKKEEIVYHIIVNTTTKLE